MRRLGLLAVVGLLSLSAATASAHTSLVLPPEPSHPYQAWVDAAFVPTPDVQLTVSEDVSVCEISCTDRTSTIYMQVTHTWDRFIFLHELGHVWDYNAMKPRQRVRFSRIVGRPNLPWDTAEAPGLYSGLDEWFADTYAICALRKRISPKIFGVNIGDGVLDGPGLRRVCGMIRHS